MTPITDIAREVGATVRTFSGVVLAEFDTAQLTAFADRILAEEKSQHLAAYARLLRNAAYRAQELAASMQEFADDAKTQADDAAYLARAAEPAKPAPAPAPTESYWLRGFNHGNAGEPFQPPTTDGEFAASNRGYANGYEAGRAAIRSSPSEQVKD